MTPFEVKWDAPEFEYREKSVGWYWMSIIIAVLVLAVAMWQRNFLFGFFVVVAELLVLVWGSRAPRTLTFTVTEKGLTIDGRRFYPWNDIENFGVDEEAELPGIVLRSHRRFLPMVRIHVPKDRLANVRENLRRGAAEVAYEATLTEALDRFFRF